jgi:hypothetical protein
MNQALNGIGYLGSILILVSYLNTIFSNIAPFKYYMYFPSTYVFYIFRVCFPSFDHLKDETRWSQWPRSLKRGSWQLRYRDHGFESHSRHVCLSLSSCVVGGVARGRTSDQGAVAGVESLYRNFAYEVGQLSPRIAERRRKESKGE